MTLSLISGFMVGCEWFTDEDDGVSYFILDLGIVRAIYSYGGNE